MIGEGKKRNTHLLQKTNMKLLQAHHVKTGEEVKTLLKLPSILKLTERNLNP